MRHVRLVAMMCITVRHKLERIAKLLKAMGNANLVVLQAAMAQDSRSLAICLMVGREVVRMETNVGSLMTLPQEELLCYPPVK